MRNWVLPEYVEDVLPAEAWRLELLRRRLLDHFAAHGYELVMPPMIEYLESLLTGTGHDLDLRTFKLVDQLSGRMLGVRADITPQVTRVDAHLLNRRGVTRLAYCGTVLHARPAAASHSREVLQLGAELFGHAGVDGDVEIQRLMLDALRLAGVNGMHLDLGHVGLFRALCQHADVPPELEKDLFVALQGKDVPALRGLTAPLPSLIRTAMLALPDLYGGAEVLREARSRLPTLPEVELCLTQLERMATQLNGHVDVLLFDLGELRGYHYHSGAVFAAYASGSSNALAQGGRYDEVGKAFGRARPATGFSLDLRTLASVADLPDPASPIYAPAEGGDRLKSEIARLRAAGEVVIVALPGEDATLDAESPVRELVETNGSWHVVQRP